MSEKIAAYHNKDCEEYFHKFLGRADKNMNCYFICMYSATKLFFEVSILS